MEPDRAKIRLLREALGLTTEQLAQRLNLSRQAVEAWERKGVGSFRVLNRLAQALGVRPESLIKRSEE